MHKLLRITLLGAKQIPGALTNWNYFVESFQQNLYEISSPLQVYIYKWAFMCLDQGFYKSLLFWNFFSIWFIVAFPLQLFSLVLIDLL